MKVYVVDTHYGCQVVTDAREWVTRLKLARLTLLTRSAGLKDYY